MDQKQNLDNYSLDDLIKLRDSTTNARWEHYRKFQELEKTIQKIEHRIYTKCEHNWELDYSASGPYDGPDRICTKCNLYRDARLYTPVNN